ncbi:hypothetical protein ACJX0J_016261, partial [Zea mays]
MIYFYIDHLQPTDVRSTTLLDIAQMFLNLFMKMPHFLPPLFFVWPFHINFFLESILHEMGGGHE